MGFNKQAKRPPTAVTIDGLGEVHIRALTMGELRRIQNATTDDDRAFLLLSAVVDADGKPVFTDLAELDDMGNDVLTDLAAAVGRVTSPGIDAQKK
jgi:hypothetical protein